MLTIHLSLTQRKKKPLGSYLGLTRPGPDRNEWGVSHNFPFNGPLVINTACRQIESHVKSEKHLKGLVTFPQIQV